MQQRQKLVEHSCGVLDDGRKVTTEMYERFKVEELEKIKREIGEDAYQKGRFSKAVQLFDELILQDDFVDFLTLPGYENL